ncbi:VOC family protein [Actinoplanes sp. CA-142083]|uniref:VOC family protein n=1 Tax=Actinoplanes sp. CA-142083 TaxID=3239903 RepID=UPI003D8F1924
MTVNWTLTIDCRSPAAMAAFWATALGYVEASPPAGFASWEEWAVKMGVPEEEWDDGAAIEDPEGIRPRISFLKVPEPKTVKNRVHLDIQAGGGRAEPQEIRWARVQETVARLLAAGGTVRSEVFRDDGTPDHVVMADPEDNEFCVV